MGIIVERPLHIQAKSRDHEIVRVQTKVSKGRPCRTPLHKECPKHHGHEGDPRVTPMTCGAIGDRAQVILV